MSNRIYTVLLVICGLVIAAFVMIATGNLVIKTEPATDTSTSSKALEQNRIVYVLPEAEEGALTKTLE